VIARMRGFFLRVALPSPTDIGQYFSTMSYKCAPLFSFLEVQLLGSATARPTARDAALGRVSQLLITTAARILGYSIESGVAGWRPCRRTPKG
jgi:hypothetical protein